MSKYLALRKNPTMPKIKVTPVVKNIVGITAVAIGGINCVRLLNQKVRTEMKAAGTNIPLYVLQNIVFVAAGLILLSDRRK